ncbi:MAG: peptidyl-prolyl cis-trans isomerase [Proteobacteria bacterium]|nr:peptidyl-prolyl cis-trans isomerase [Pseudomonadota bacterium]
MFDQIRDAVKNSILVKIMLGALMVSFGIFGIGDFVGTGGLDPNVAVKVGKREMNMIEFQRRYDTQYDRFKESVGGQLPDNEAMRRSIMDAVVAEITRSSLVEGAADDLGVVVTDEQLRDNVRKMEVFNDETGNFSQRVFGEVLAQNNLSEAAFLEMMRGEIRQRALMQPIALGGAAPGFLTDSLFTYRNEGRSADTLLVPTKTITVADKPADADLKALYDQNLAVFKRPEYRKLSVLSMKSTELVKPESFTEDEIKTYYEQNPGRFRTPEKRRVAQLVFDSKEAADKVRALAAPGDTLADLAAKAKMSAIDLGEQTKDSIIGKSMGAAYDLPLNEISQPTQSDLGWHLFATTALTPAHETPLAEATANIRKLMSEERGLDALYRASTDVQDALAAGTPMNEIANNLGATLTQIEAVDQTGKDPSGAQVPGIIDPQTFLTTAFSLPTGGDSGLKDLPQRDGYYVVKVESITAEAPRPMEEVRTELTAMWQRDKALAEARATADKIAAEIGASTDMSSMGTKDGKLSYGLLTAVTRFGQPLDRFHMVDTGRLSAAMLGKLFAAKPGEVFTAETTDGVVIARLKEVVTPQAIGPQALARNQIAGDLRNAVTGDIMEQMTAEFTKRYPVEVNHTLVDQIVKTTR